jgi:SWIM zinc finger
MSVAAQVVDPQSASLALTLLQSKAGNRWARAVEEMKTSRLRVAGDFPEFIVTNKSGTAYKVKLDPHGSGSCTCPDFQVRIAQDGRICKHIAAAAITSLAPQVKVSSPANGNGSVRAFETATAEVSPLIFRIRRTVQTDGKGSVQVEVQARVTNDEAQDQQTASYAYELLDRLASIAVKNTAPSEHNHTRETASPSTAKPTLVKSRTTSAMEGSPVHAVITKIDRMKTRQGESLFLKVDVGGETVRVFGRPEELAERLEASGYDIPASEVEAGMELHLPCLVKVGQGKNGYKNIEEFLPEAAQ